MSVIYDFGFHPDEPDVRLFVMPRSGLLRLDDEAFVSEVRYGNIVLRHYALHQSLVQNQCDDRPGGQPG